MRLPVSRSNGQRSGIQTGGSIQCRPNSAATLLIIIVTKEHDRGLGSILTKPDTIIPMCRRLRTNSIGPLVSNTPRLCVCDSTGTLDCLSLQTVCMSASPSRRNTPPSTAVSWSACCVTNICCETPLRVAPESGGLTVIRPTLCIG